MKKKCLRLLLLTVCIPSTAWTVGSVANIQIAGDIRPPTCLVNGGNEDLLYDLGDYSPSLIPDTGVYAFPSIRKSLSISCDAETYLTFRAIDLYSNVETVLPDEQNVNAKSSTFNLVNAENTSQ